MKKLLLGLTLLTSMSSFARSPESVCLDLIFDSEKSTCIEIINSGYISYNAADVCGGLVFDNGVNQCLRAALNKEYTSGEVQVCSSNAFDSGAVKCMINSGRQYQGGYDDVDHGTSAEEKILRIEKLAKKAKKQIRRGEYSQALTSIVTIIELASTDDY